MLNIGSTLELPLTSVAGHPVSLGRPTTDTCVLGHCLCQRWKRFSILLLRVPCYLEKPMLPPLDSARASGPFHFQECVSRKLLKI